MDEKNRDNKRNGGCSKGNGRCNNKKRFTTVEEEDGVVGGECSGKYCCRSCTAGLIADCIALCCCPCAFLHCFALAFIKAPWFIGRKCFNLRNKKNKNNKKEHQFDDVNVVLERNNNNVDKEGGLKMGWSDSSSAPIQNNNGGFEAEKVWLELYQIGHLDFGRVSFSGD